MERSTQRSSPLFQSAAQVGFSVIEFIVAVALLSIISFAFMGWVQASYKGIGGVKEANDISKTMSRLRAAFGDDDVSCSQMLANKALQQPIMEVLYWDGKDNWLVKDKVNQQPALKEAETIDSSGSVKVKQILLEPVADLGGLYPTASDPKVVIADLEVSFERVSGPDIVRRVPLYLVLMNNRVLKCSTSAASVTLVNQRICEVKNDGYAYYGLTPKLNSDPPEYCYDLPAVKWFQGATPYSASCGSGYQVALSTEHIVGPAAVVCRARTANGGYFPPRTYQGGAGGDITLSDNTVASSSSLVGTLPNSSCSFVYQVGFDPSAFISEIKCVKP